MKKQQSQGSRVIPQPVKGGRPAAKHDTRMALQSSAINKKVAEIRRKNKGGG